MEWLDWSIAAVVVFAALQGFRRGTLVTLVSAVAVVAGYLAASYWYISLGDIVRRSLGLYGSWVTTLSFTALLLAVYWLIGVAITAAVATNKLSSASRLLGVIAGLIKGALLAIALLIVAMASPISDPIRTDAKRSLLATYALQAHKIGATALDNVLPNAIRPFGVRDERF